MKRLGWMAGAKALAATTALACGAMGASTAAQADIYNFTYTQYSASYATITGSFQTNISGIGTGYSSNFSNFTFNYSPYRNTIIGDGSISNGFGSVYFISDQGNYSSATGAVVGNSSAFSFGALSGLFAAVNTAVPGGGGGGGGSGGAPTPEVNAGLGILIAGASFAFLRRKRGTGHEATTA